MFGNFEGFQPIVFGSFYVILRLILLGDDENAKVGIFYYNINCLNAINQSVVFIATLIHAVV